MIYLDNSATTKPYKEVIDSFVRVSTEFWGNPSSLHGLGGQSEKLLSHAREQAANILNVKPNEIVFTSGGTESNNLAIKGVATHYQGRGKHIITTSIEHPSVRNPFEQLRNEGFEITYLPVDSFGRVELQALERAMREDTILVSVMHVNNEIGTIQPIKEIGQIVKKYPKALLHVDGVQGYGKVPLSLKMSGVDLYSLSGHKFHGLKGTGLLFMREGIVLSPLITGGSQERGLRSGTESVAGAVSLAKAMRLANDQSRDGIKNMQIYQAILFKQLNEIDGVVINTPIDESPCAPHILNFSIPGLKSETFVHTLEESGIYVSTTSACSSKKKKLSQVLIQMGKNEEIAGSSIRISLDYHHDLEEINVVSQKIKQAIQLLSEVKKK